MLELKNTDMTNHQQASTESAREFAVSAHGNQKYGDEPYSVHLDDVARTVEELGFFGDELQVLLPVQDFLLELFAGAPWAEYHLPREVASQTRTQWIKLNHACT